MATGIVFPSSSTRDLLVKNPEIINLPVTTPNVEQVYSFTGSIRKMSIKCRGTATIKLAFTVGDSGSNYITLHPGTIMTEDNFELPVSLYFQLDRNDVVEILTWSKL
jgi:hypothetical protein